MLLAVPCDDGHGAHTDLVDCASAAADHDDIAGLDRSVHQQNDPGDEISECLLQTKADGQTGRARENRKCGKIDTRYVDADKKGDNDDCERRQFLREQFLCRIKVADSRNAMFCRSEEHTSELQSLMRISYAVFCLKKKNT